MSTSTRETTLTEDLGAYLRYQLRGWRRVAAAAVIFAVPALWFGWPWLVAAGLAPLLLAMAPCAVMCAAGLCMSRAGKKSDAGSSASEGAAISAMQRADPDSKSEQVPGSCCAKSASQAETDAPR